MILGYDVARTARCAIKCDRLGFRVEFDMGVGLSSDAKSNDVFRAT